MKIFKSHFWYNKRQRNGIFFLLLIILVLQVTYWMIGFNQGTEKEVIESIELIAFQQKIDSFKLLEIERRKPKLYPFNPNFISDFKGYKLGMLPEEIDRLLEFRKKGRYVNSARDFQRVTKISDSLLRRIAPYFKFPDWVLEKNRKKQEKYLGKNIRQQDIVEQSNLISDLESFQIIKKININTAQFKEVLKIPGINYDLCKKIFEYRDEVAELQDISELRNIKDFPLEKYDRIIVYLEAK
ncbi:conserved protein of unknown function [Tenacibaculum sp. 190130A14a]|uniref:Helix-hairpin-helix domain-containing protein n=1 Tax=Tenacibaculum polynesiense TaxID=3137857 RepID=A0ABM9P7H0_9FLAO